MWFWERHCSFVHMCLRPAGSAKYRYGWYGMVPYPYRHGGGMVPYHTYIPPYQGSMVPLVQHRFSFCLRHRHVLAENDCVVSSRYQLFAHILRFCTPASPRLPWIITGKRRVVRTIDVTRKRFGEIREIKKADSRSRKQSNAECRRAFLCYHQRAWATW